MKNNTWNQHFISQVEQRLNAISSEVSKEKQKIYSFNVVDRENYNIELVSETGKLIEKNLSFDDLFTFEILTEGQRLNFENVFRKYEDDVGRLTKSLLRKIKTSNSVENEVFKIFTLKLLNTFRNPYNIKETLSIINNSINYYPNDDVLKSLHEKIDNFSHPKESSITEKYAVSIKEYKEWMKSLFIVLVPKVEGGKNILESIAESLFYSGGQSPFVFVCDFSGIDGGHPLLSDRGHTVLNYDDKVIRYEFNLSSVAYISYMFADVKDYAESKGIDVNMINGILRFNNKNPPRIKVALRKDESELLSNYNKNVIFQSFNTVFCKSKIIYGL